MVVDVDERSAHATPSLAPTKEVEERGQGERSANSVFKPIKVAKAITNCPEKEARPRSHCDGQTAAFVAGILGV